MPTDTQARVGRPPIGPRVATRLPEEVSSFFADLAKERGTVVAVVLREWILDRFGTEEAADNGVVGVGTGQR